MKSIDAELLQLLDQNLAMLNKAANVFTKSYKICHKIGIKKKYTFEKLTEFEALSSRFARLVDLLIQKIFRLIDELNLAPSSTIRDSINRAEKNLLVDSAESLVEMKHLRNQISHEYLIDKLTDLFERVVVLAPTLQDCIDRTLVYCSEKWNYKNKQK